MIELPELAAAVNVSERQMDYWVRKGYVQPTNPYAGSGNGARRFTDGEEEVVVCMAGLVKIGVKPLQASRWARVMVRGGLVKIGRFVVCEVVNHDRIGEEPGARHVAG